MNSAAPVLQWYRPQSFVTLGQSIRKPWPQAVGQVPRQFWKRSAKLPPTRTVELGSPQLLVVLSDALAIVSGNAKRWKSGSSCMATNALSPATFLGLPNPSSNALRR